MFYLIYASTAVRVMTQDELMCLYNECQGRNSEYGITGVLLYHGGYFLQLLEGGEQTVQKLYAKIKMDRRHKDITKILSGYIQKRNYDDWSMGFPGMVGVGIKPDYYNYVRKKLIMMPFQNDALLAKKCMLKTMPLSLSG